MKSFALSHFIRGRVASEGSKIPYEQALSDLAARKDRLLQEAKELLYPNGFYSPDDRQSGLTYSGRMWVRFFANSAPDTESTVMYFLIEPGSRIKTGHHNIVNERMAGEAGILDDLESALSEAMYETSQTILKLTESCRSSKQLLEVWPDALPLLEKYDPNRYVEGNDDPLTARTKLAKLVGDNFNKRGCDTLIKIPASVTIETTPPAETTA